MEKVQRYKTLGFSVPPLIATRIDEVIRTRRFTRSEFFREMFRAWERLDNEAQRNKEADKALMQLFSEVHAEEKKKPTPKKKLVQEFNDMSKLLQKKAKERGLVITEDGEIVENKCT